MEGKSEAEKDVENAVVEAAWDFVAAAETQLHVPAVDSVEFRQLLDAVAALRVLGVRALEGNSEGDDWPVLDERGFVRRRKLGVVRRNYFVPVVPDGRVPPGMAAIGYDKDSKLVALVNIDKAKPD